MKTHEHALISIGFTAGISLLSTGTIGDWSLYVAALVGGELIDFIDHPLYHLLYQRNTPVVRQGFAELKKHGVKAYLQYLKKAEDNRDFNRLLLHNVISLSLVALMGVLFGLWLPSTTVFFVAYAAFMLHMITDMLGDFQLKGNSDNWLWVISPERLEKIGQMGRRYVVRVWGWWACLLLAFVIVNLRWAWQMRFPDTRWGLIHEMVMHAESRNSILSSAPLFLLFMYFLLLVGIILAGHHKYRLETGTTARSKTGNPGSLQTFWQFLAGKSPKTGREFDQVLLKMQADSAKWILILTSLIALGLLLCSWLQVQNPLIIILVATVPALAFGTLIHPTIGEFGGVLGVLLAALLNIVLSRFGLQGAWSPITGLILFAAAAGAWVLGLVGGIFLRGQLRQSLGLFLVQITMPPGVSISTQTLQKTIQLTSGAVEEGYRRARQQLFGGQELPEVRKTPHDVVILPCDGVPLLLKNHTHLRATDVFVPLLSETAYVLCDNLLMSKSCIIGEYGLLPVLPNNRLAVEDPLDGEAHWENGKCQWHSRRRKVDFLTPRQDHCSPHPAIPVMVANKSLGDHFDDMVTRKVNIITDIYIFPRGDCRTITICGVNRSSTSTKEYCSMEAETYAGWVQQCIAEAVESNQLGTAHRSSARLVYPRVSSWDQGLNDDFSRNSVPLSQAADGCLHPEDVHVFQEVLGMMPQKKLIFSASADFSRRILVLALQVAVTILLTLLGMDSTLIDLIQLAF